MPTPAHPCSASLPNQANRTPRPTPTASLLHPTRAVSALHRLPHSKARWDRPRPFACPHPRPRPRPHLHPAPPSPGRLRHWVSFRLTPEAPADEIVARLLALDALECVRTIHFGNNCSPEGKSRGHTHGARQSPAPCALSPERSLLSPPPIPHPHPHGAGCLVTFTDVADRDAYLVDPEHVAFTGASPASLPPNRGLGQGARRHTRPPPPGPNSAATHRAQSSSHRTWRTSSSSTLRANHPTV